MSIEYDANFGIGYKIVGDDTIFAVLDKLSTKFVYYCIGDSFDSFQLEFIVIIKDPFKNGYNLLLKKQELDDELLRLGIKPSGKFDVVGDLYIH